MNRFDAFQKHAILLSTVVIMWLVTLLSSGVIYGKPVISTGNDTIISSVDSHMVTVHIKNDSNALQMLHLFAISTTQQTGLVVTIEATDSVSNFRLPEFLNDSLSIHTWLKRFQSEIPGLNWIYDDGAVHIYVPNLQLQHNALEDKFPSNYIASLTVEEWFTWLSEQLPKEDFFQGIGTSDGLNVYGFGPLDGGSENVTIKVTRGENVRQFLTDLAHHYKGTWIAELKESTQKTLMPLANNYRHIGHIKETNTISLIK